MDSEDIFRAVIALIILAFLCGLLFGEGKKESDLLKKEAVERGYADVSAGQWHWLKKVGE